MTDLCWHQRQRADLAAARERVAALDEGIMKGFFDRLWRCRKRLAASDRAMARGDHQEAIKLLWEELNDDGRTPQ